MYKKGAIVLLLVLLARTGSSWLQSSERKAILARPNATHSPAILAGDTLYLAGQGSRNPQTGQPPEGIDAATRQTMQNLKTVLDAAGFTFDDVVSTNVWMTDISKFAEMSAAYRSFFKGDLPSRTTIAVHALPGGSCIEIAMIAYRGEKRAIYPPAVERGKAPYSPAILAGETLYISGQGGIDRQTGKAVEGGIAASISQTLKNIEAILKSAGMDFSHVVGTQVYLTDLDHFEQMNQIYRSHMPPPRPVRATVGASALPFSLPVEITMTAARRSKQEIVPEGVSPSPNFSRGLVVGDAVYLAGVAGRGDTIQEQVRYCVGELEKVLKTAGLSLANVVDSKVYLTDIDDYTAMNEVYKTYFPNEPPARSTVVVPDLVGEAKVEIVFTARKDKRDS